MSTQAQISEESLKELRDRYILALTKLGTVAGLVGFEADKDVETIRAQVFARMSKLRAIEAAAPPVSPAEKAEIEKTVETYKAARSADGASV